METVPFLAILSCLLLILHRFDVVPLDYLWWFLGTCCIGITLWVIFGNLEFDFNQESILSLIGIVTILGMYVYVIPAFCEHPMVAVIGGAIFIYLLLKFKWGLIDSGSSHSTSVSYRPVSKNRHSTNKTKATHTVTVQGVYQLNGPKPFKRVIECSKSKTGYYSQMMGNKTQQAQWIRTHFPGAKTDRGFSMTINIK